MRQRERGAERQRERYTETVTDREIKIRDVEEKEGEKREKSRKDYLYNQRVLYHQPIRTALHRLCTAIGERHRDAHARTARVLADIPSQSNR